LAQAPAQTPTPAQTPSATPQLKPAPFMTAGPRVDLSIEDAVARARDKNIDISVARITPRLTDFTIAGLEANYRLNATSALGKRNNTTAVTNQTQGGTGTSQTTGTASWQGG